MRENRPYGSEGGASQTNGTSLPPIVGDFAVRTTNIMTDRHFADPRSGNSYRRHYTPGLEKTRILAVGRHRTALGGGAGGGDSILSSWK